MRGWQFHVDAEIFADVLRKIRPDVGFEVVPLQVGDTGHYMDHWGIVATPKSGEGMPWIVVRGGEPEHARFRSALVELAELRGEKPETKDYEQDEVGARAHAVAMKEWSVAQIARKALGEI
jgi:hypothetical protein